MNYSPNFFCPPGDHYPNCSTPVGFRPILPNPSSVSSVMSPPSWDTFVPPSSFPLIEGFPPGKLPYSEPSTSVAPKTKRSRKSKKKPHVNLKERRRNLAINEAFSQLQQLIPYASDEEKLPKIKTLRLATNYIGFLTQVLHEDSRMDQASQSANGSGPDSGIDFSQIAAAEIKSKNSYKQRAEILIQDNGRLEIPSEERHLDPHSALGTHTWPKCECCPF